MSKTRVLKFLAEARLDRKRQSEYRLDELHAQIKPKIEFDKLNLYLIDLKEKGLIKVASIRPNAYNITPKGRVYHSSSSWSRMSTTHKLAIITITITTILGFLNLWYCGKCL